MIRAARNYCVLPLLAICLVFSGCMPEYIELPVRISSVSTGSPENVTASTATLNGNVTLYDSEKINCGFIYDISSNLTDTKGIKMSTTANGDYAFNISGLNAGTTYYYRAYAVEAGQYRYGDVRSFNTIEAIDLGLSVKWASCNVGATSPEGYGDYFAWGETTTKSSYSSSNSVTYGLYASELESCSIIDADGDLTAAYDVATVNWGGDWRMPTSAEIGELIHKCSWSWTTRNGVKGCKVTGPNGSSIFLPAAGYRSTTAFYSAGSHGYYWSGTLHGAGSYDAYGFNFYWNYNISRDYSSRDYGFTVRPVYGVTVSTGHAAAITANGARLVGSIDGAVQSVTCGIIYGTSSDLSSSNGTQMSTTSSEYFFVDVTGLSPNTTYYYRAYVVVDGEYKYGDVHSFTTKQNVSVTTGDAIDLGLSVKWASCNVGATSPEEYGDYFAWGETTPKLDNYTSNSVTYGLSASELESCDIIGADGNLTAAYDAATVNWGGDWRMPTLNEIGELIHKCSWSWTTRNGVKGCKVTGPNGSSIFLPAAGYRGYYWSASPYGGSSSAFTLYFDSGYYFWDYSDRYYGRAVRPVSEK